jgi:outer membrane immunogenic protein
MKSRGFLLATSAGFAFAPNAQAADLPLKAPVPAPLPADWTGFYIGAHAGAAWQFAQNNQDPYNDKTAPATTTNTGFIGGGQIGYNFQRGNFVYGLEADISGLSGKGTGTINDFTGSTYSASNQVRWLSTVRARLGLAVGDTMVYATAGVAFGGVKNNVTINPFNCCGSEGTRTYSESKTRAGLAVGGGVSHMWDRNWIVSLEGMFVDLGRSTAAGVIGSPGEVPHRTKTTKFSNQAVIARVKLDYKF